LLAPIAASFCGITVNGCTVGKSTNVDNTCIQASGAFGLTVTGSKLFSQVSVSVPPAGASLVMNGSGVADTVPFHLTAGTLQYVVLGCQQLSTDGFTVVGQFANRCLPGLVSP
jgi:hypothetical protein